MILCFFVVFNTRQKAQSKNEIVLYVICYFIRLMSEQLVVIKKNIELITSI